MYKDDYSFPEFMNLAEFWTKYIDNAHEIIKPLEDIKKFNNEISSKLSCLHSLNKSEEVIYSKELIDSIKSYKLPSKEMYDSNGELVTSNYYAKIIDNTNIDKIQASILIRYGMSVRKTSVRSFPTEEAIYSSTNDIKLNNFDRFQETGGFAFEPVLILHESSDKQWYFAKLYNYIGWIKAADIAIAQDKNEIFNYSSCENYLTITGKEVNLTLEDDCSNKTIKLGMGTNLCLSSSNEIDSPYTLTVKIPARDSEGILFFKKAYLNKNEDFVIGSLPYTRYNIIKQALKYLGTTYDWGDKFQGKDCSSFILTIYRCFGFLLPRNADQQENSFTDISNSLVFNETDDLEVRYNNLSKLKPGAALFMRGHVMMYLGKYNKNHYMIHSFLGYAVNKASSFEARTALCVAISPVDMLTSGGTPFIKKFTSAVHFQ